MEKMDEAIYKKGDRALKPRKAERLYDGLTLTEFKKLVELENILELKRKSPTSRYIKHIIAQHLSYCAGLRIQETIRLKPHNFDLSTGKIKILEGKGSKDRITYYVLFDSELKFNPEWMKYLPLGGSKSSYQKVFHSLTVRLGFNEERYSYETNEGVKRNKFLYSYHSLRHGFALELIDRGVPLNIIQELLGHENLMTTSRYLKVRGKHVLESLKKYGL